MCLIKGQGAFNCSHPTCIRSAGDPNFIHTTKSAVFKKKGDFNKVAVFTSTDGASKLVRPINPHRRRSVNWPSFEYFKRSTTFYAAGAWPDRNVFSKLEIDFQYFLFGRRIPVIDPLTETYSSEIILDVEEAAVYVGS